MKVDLSIITDPVNELTLVEKLSCTVRYGDSWWDDLEFAVRAVSGLDLSFMLRNMSVHECPIIKPPMDKMCPGKMSDHANGSCWYCTACEWYDDHGPIEHRPVLSDRSIYLFHH